MSDGIKVQGKEDIGRLRDRRPTWEPPATLADFLGLVRLVIETSKYTDGFMTGEDALQNLRTFVRVKANRVYQHPDLEECVDVAAYAYMVYHRLLQDAGEV